MEKKEFTQSFFRFEITQTTKVLMYKIRMGDGKRWNIDGDEECGHITLMEPGRSVNNTLVLLGRGYMRIITACSGYEYLIQDKEDGDGAEVTFSGPVNALLAQSLMPRMRYVPGTLRGMSEDMPDYAPIVVTSNEACDASVATSILQDWFLDKPLFAMPHGWRVNMKFNNELVPYFPPFEGEMRENPKKRRRRERTGKFARR